MDKQETLAEVVRLGFTQTVELPRKGCVTVLIHPTATAVLLGVPAMVRVVGLGAGAWEVVRG